MVKTKSIIDSIPTGHGQTLALNLIRHIRLAAEEGMSSLDIALVLGILQEAAIETHNEKEREEREKSH